MANTDKIRVLFLCSHNQARSQMAEGLLRHYGGNRFEVFSAGNHPVEQVHPLAVKALADMGIDISWHRSKHVNEFLDQTFDYVITTCDRAKDTCPTFPNDPEMRHWSLPDPAQFEGTEVQRLNEFKRVATELAGRIRLLTQLPAPPRKSGV